MLVNIVKKCMIDNNMVYNFPGNFKSGVDRFANIAD